MRDNKHSRKQNKNKEPEKELLFGIHSVKEAILAKRRNIFELYVSNDPRDRLTEVIEKAEENRIPVKNISPAVLSQKTASEHHQGLAALADPFPMSSEYDIIRDAGRFLLLLDGILDTHNLGALLRTALSAGVEGVILPKDRAAAPSPSVSRISAGAMEHMRIAAVTNLSRTIADLKGKGFWIYGTDRDTGKNLYQTELVFPLALIIGNEEKGIRPLVRKNCDFLLSIPQQGPLDSLNASVAGAVCMYECLRQQMANGMNACEGGVSK